MLDRILVFGKTRARRCKDLNYRLDLLALVDEGWPGPRSGQGAARSAGSLPCWFQLVDEDESRFDLASLTALAPTLIAVFMATKALPSSSRGLFLAYKALTATEMHDSLRSLANKGLSEALDARCRALVATRWYTEAMELVDDLVRVEVWIPRNRISELYDSASRWTRETPAPRTPTADRTEETAGPDGMQAGALLGWDEGPIAMRQMDAHRLMNTVSPNARRIVEYLSDHPGESFSAGEIAQTLDLSGVSSFTGTLASIGNRSRTLRRITPIRYETGDDGGKYSMDSDIAKYFRGAKERVKERAEQRKRFQDYELAITELIRSRERILEQLNLQKKNTSRIDEKIVKDGERELARINEQIAELEASIRKETRSLTSSGSSAPDI